MATSIWWSATTPRAPRTASCSASGTSARPGAASPPSRSPFPWCGAGHEPGASDWTGSCAGWRRHRHGSPGCRARARSRSGRTPIWSPSPPTRAGGAAHSSTATPSRPTPAATCPASPGGPGCGGCPPTAPRSGDYWIGEAADLLLLLALLAGGLVVELRVVRRATGRIGVAERSLGRQLLDPLLRAGLQVVRIGGGHVGLQTCRRSVCRTVPYPRR